jgi:hypothetical protein
MVMEVDVNPPVVARENVGGFGGEVQKAEDQERGEFPEPSP